MEHIEKEYFQSLFDVYWGLVEPKEVQKSVHMVEVKGEWDVG